MLGEVNLQRVKHTHTQCDGLKYSMTSNIRNAHQI